MLEKLRLKHQVSLEEVRQCFLNRDGGLLEDQREDHKTNPLTEWFIAETDHGRKLKVCFVQVGVVITLKTAYTPNDEEIRIYNANAY
jgi:uncharacterized DUF497 family protein